MQHKGRDRAALPGYLRSVGVNTSMLEMDILSDSEIAAIAARIRELLQETKNNQLKDAS